MTKETANNPLDDFIKDSSNLINVPNKEILDGNIFEEIVLKAIVIMLTEMKTLNSQYQLLVNEALVEKKYEKMDDAKKCLDLMHEIENNYLFFENNLDKITEIDVRNKLKDMAIEILFNHL